MFNFRNKTISTPPRSSDLNCICHSELVSESHELKISAGLPRFARNDAFTLAEVLITLVIIGVIAAITVPTLIVKYQKEQTITKLKKVYSTLAQTTQRAIADNGPITIWETVSTGEGANNFNKKYLLPYLNILKNCENNSEGICEFKYNLMNNAERQYTGTTARFILSDGTFVNTATFSSTHEKYVVLTVDINGKKKPNIFGRDIFQFIYLTYWTPSDVHYVDSALLGKITPVGYQINDRTELLNDTVSGCNKNSTGAYCTALIMKDGWRIADDYPW